MTDSLRLLFAVLTCYRLAQLLVYDDGPLFVFDRLRTFTEDRKIKEQARGKLKGPWASLDGVVTCPFCVGLWASIVCLVLIIYPTYPGDLFLLWWGIAGGQAYLQERQTK